MKYVDFIDENNWGVTVLAFELFRYNLNMEWWQNSLLSLTNTK